jgi:hypothetical protein
VAPSSSVCSLSTMPTRRLPTSLAGRFLRHPRGAQVLAVELQQVESQIAFKRPPFRSQYGAQRQSRDRRRGAPHSAAEPVLAGSG